MSIDVGLASTAAIMGVAYYVLREPRSLIRADAPALVVFCGVLVLPFVERVRDLWFRSALTKVAGLAGCIVLAICAGVLRALLDTLAPCDWCGPFSFGRWFNSEGLGLAFLGMAYGVAFLSVAFLRQVKGFRERSVDPPAEVAVAAAVALALTWASLALTDWAVLRCMHGWQDLGTALPAPTLLTIDLFERHSIASTLLGMTGSGIVLIVARMGAPRLLLLLLYCVSWSTVIGLFLLSLALPLMAIGLNELG